MAISKVYLFVPNLIGYARVLLAVFGFAVAEHQPLVFFLSYTLSELLDQWDGFFARLLGQSSRFGAILDMVTDRCSTTCLMMLLARFYPQYSNLLLFLVALDITSHYAHLYSTMASGKKSHKDLSDNYPRLLRFYYGNRHFMYVLCFGNEAAFLFAYLLHFPSWTGPVLLAHNPLYTASTPASCAPFVTPSLTLTQALFWISLPICAFKQLMNLIQLWQSARDVVKMDEVDHKLAPASQHPASHKQSSKSSAAAAASPKAEPAATAATAASSSSPSGVRSRTPTRARK